MRGAANRGNAQGFATYDSLIQQFSQFLANMRNLLYGTNTRLRDIIGMTSCSLATAFAELEGEWLACSERKILLKLIEKHILPNQRIDIDSALCLGLGSFSNRSLKRLKFPHRLSSHSDGLENSDQSSQAWSLMYRTSSSFEDEDEDHACRDRTSHEDSRDTNMAHDGGLRNVGLYQLLLFETVLECLRTLKIPSPLLSFLYPA